MAKLQDTMIMARDYEKMIKFYNEFVGLDIIDKNEHWATLRDKETNQVLSITNGPSVRSVSPGIEVENIEHALQAIKLLGGSVHKRWELGSMKGANCYDPENNEIMVWQGPH